MLRKRRWLTGALCAVMLATSVSAAEQHLSPADFGEGLAGVWITAAPEGNGLYLGSRAIRAGDVLTADQLQSLTVQEGAETVIRYLPIREDGVDTETELVFSRKNEAPSAGDSMMETYRNLPNEGLLAVSDPEGEKLTFTLTRAPRRGEVILRDDGSFLYTPEKNKVGTDSFTFTAADPAGNVSREATVTVRILKPTDEKQYTDTLGSDCRFEAEWLRSTGIFSGETVNGQFCFSPDEPVSRGQFLAMLMKVLQMPVDRSVKETGFVDESPDWLKPYLAAALRSGIIAGYPGEGGAEFRAEQTVTVVEAQRMTRSALRFAVPAAAMDELEAEAVDTSPMTRADAAKKLYRLSRLRREHTGFFGLAG
ncbi:MAG: S-layer homology domain-containing protein [Oscillospiraceae bacterium]|nr:S-layer homology domain-containing protein [Oscillospiraceae bacterium]